MSEISPPGSGAESEAGLNQTTQIKPPGDGSRAVSSKRSKRWIVENVLALVLALVLVFMFRSSVVEIFKIPSGSMIPTLLIGDHIAVNKFAYGLKVPFSDWFSGQPTYILHRDPPQRGDIIVFIYPKDESFYYIKRVVGVPGDVIEIKDRRLIINQKPVARELLTGEAAEKIFKGLDDPRYSPTNLDLYEEKLSSATGDRSHLLLLDKNNFMAENHPPVTVPPDSLFVMGDNRDFSNDSRFWGFVPLKNVKGRAMFVWLSISLSLSDGQFIFRGERIGTVLR